MAAVGVRLRGWLYDKERQREMTAKKKEGWGEGVMGEDGDGNRG